MIRPDEAFWRPRIEALAATGLPHQYRMMEESGRLGNFRAVAGTGTGTGTGGRQEGRRGYRFDDSDVYKWLEACAYVLASVPNAPLRAMCDDAIALVAAAQDADGYLNTYYTLYAPDERWAHLSTSHEMYCAGHLIEAAVAWSERLDDDRLMTVALRFADLIESRYGANGEDAIDGHPELELALLRLADLTGEPRWRDLAARQLDLRGRRPSVFEREADPKTPAGMLLFRRDEHDAPVYNGRYAQDHAPIAGQTTIEGHAVRAAYLYAAAARRLHDEPNEGVEAALTTLWANTVGRRMYVTGGIGSSGDNEGFTRDFDLPNHTAYCETCASCALIFWGDEMLRLTGDSEYADVIELALFNNVLAGISPQGDRYFYANPLESRGEHARVPWFGCACCPANAARTIARVEEWAIRVAADATTATAFIDFPVPGTTRVGDVELEITGDYPATGTWTLRVRAPRPTGFTLGLRIPGWANDVEIDTPDELGEAEYRAGYAVFERDWTGETVIKIDWPMPPVWLAADPRVLDDAGRLALQKGPTVYALVRGGSPVAPQRLQIDPEPEVVERADRLEVEAVYEPQDQPDLLYAPYEPKDPEETTATFVPYRDWANDGPTEMLVWARRL